MHSVLQKPTSMRTLESQTRFMARTALIGSSSIKACQQRSETAVYINKSDLRASESLTQLKLTAEKMIQEQASVKTDLLVTYSKLEKSEQDVRSLETRLQDTKNENAILRVKQQEALKLWEGLESKFCSTRTFCNQLMETLQQLALQVHEAEGGKQVLDEKLAERLRIYQEIKMQVDDLSAKKQNAERIAANWETEYGELEKAQEQLRCSLAQETTRLRQLQVEKAEVEMHLQTSNELLHQEREKLKSAEKQVDQLRREVERKAGDLKEIDKAYAHLSDMKNEVDLQVEALKVKFDSERSRNNELEQNLEIVTLKVKDLENANTLALDDVNKLSAQMASCKEWAQEERLAKEDTWKQLKELELQHEELTSLKVALEKQINDFEEKLQVLNDDRETRQQHSTQMIQELKNELDATRRKLDDLAKEKLEVVHQSQDLETKFAAVSATAEDLRNKKEQLETENSGLKLEIGIASQNAKHAIQERMGEIEKLSSKILEDTETLILQESEISKLRTMLLEKDQLIEGLMKEQKCLKVQYAEVVDQKVIAEKLGHETRRQAEAQLETKLMELNKHIKEISERNDEVKAHSLFRRHPDFCDLNSAAVVGWLISMRSDSSNLRICLQEMKEMRKKFENETREAITKEEQKAAAMLIAMREECELRITKIQELSLQSQKSCQNEHQAQIKETMQNHETEKKLLISQYQAELKKSQDFCQQLEKEKRKWMEDFEMKTKELERKHTVEIKKLSTDNSTHCSKADDRALKLEQQLNVLQEQLKEEKFKRQEDLIAATRKYEEAVHKFEADRKVYDETHKQSTLNMEAALKRELEEAKEKLSVWESKCRNLEREDPNTKTVKNKGPQEYLANQAYSSGVKGVHALSHLNEGRKTENPTEKGKGESVTLPTHSKTVTHHEYEVATSDGRKTITRKRTKSTVMFESPLDVKKMGSRKSTRLSSQHRKVKPSRVYATTMGDLFGGKSLDPYADDPYAFT